MNQANKLRMMIFGMHFRITEKEEIISMGLVVQAGLMKFLNQNMTLYCQAIMQVFSELV